MDIGKKSALFMTGFFLLVGFVSGADVSHRWSEVSVMDEALDLGGQPLVDSSDGVVDVQDELDLNGFNISGVDRIDAGVVAANQEATADLLMRGHNILEADNIRFSGEKGDVFFLQNNYTSSGGGEYRFQARDSSGSKQLLFRLNPGFAGFYQDLDVNGEEVRGLDSLQSFGSSIGFNSTLRMPRTGTSSGSDDLYPSQEIVFEPSGWDTDGFPSSAEWNLSAVGRSSWTRDSSLVFGGEDGKLLELFQAYNAGNTRYETTSASFYTDNTEFQGNIDVNGSADVRGSLDMNGNRINGVESWQDVSYQNGWTDYGSSYAPAGYYMDPMGVVHIRGLIKGGSLNSCAFTLPSSYSPSYRKIFPGNTQSAGGSSDIPCRIDIDTNGCVEIDDTCDSSWVSLEAISFRSG